MRGARALRRFARSRRTRSESVRGPNKDPSSVAPQSRCGCRVIQSEASADSGRLSLLITDQDGTVARLVSQDCGERRRQLRVVEGGSSFRVRALKVCRDGYPGGRYRHRRPAPAQRNRVVAYRFGRSVWASLRPKTLQDTWRRGRIARDDLAPAAEPRRTSHGLVDVRDQSGMTKPSRSRPLIQIREQKTPKLPGKTDQSSWTRGQGQSTRLTTLRNLQNLHPRFKSGRRLQFSVCNLRRDAVFSKLRAVRTRRDDSNHRIGMSGLPAWRACAQAIRDLKHAIAKPLRQSPE